MTPIDLIASVVLLVPLGALWGWTYRGRVERRRRERIAVPRRIVNGGRR
jgi:hypothetical protein